MPLPAPPARRIPYDVNGATVLYQLPDAGDPSTKDLETAWAGGKADLNDEDDVSVGNWWTNDRNRIIIILPEKWDLVAYLVGHSDTAPGVVLDDIEVSTDTTTGLDGTWVSHGSPSKVTEVFANYRSPTLWTQAGIKGFRVTLSAMNIEEFTAVHLWGTITSGETPDRLAWIDDGLGTEYAIAEDGGDVPRGGSVDRDVRLRNISATDTANNVTVSAEELFQAGGDDAGSWYLFSLNGASGPFQTTQNIASLGPGAEQVIRVRRVVPAATNPNPHAPRFKAVAASWT